MILVSGTGTDLTGNGYERYWQESVKPITGMEIYRKRLRKNRFSEAGNDAFRRANAAFDSIYPGMLKWSNLTTFQTGENDND
jgi:serine/threonine protein kinase HipA of HipAB toxin-antitoxin module